MSRNIIEINDIGIPELAPYVSLTESALRKDAGLFVAESPKVIRVALDAGMVPVSLLCERRHIEGDAADIIARCKEMPVYTGSREILASLTGYTLTRGVLCAMRRPVPIAPEKLIHNAARVAVIDAVCDTTNIGAIFRCAAALDIDAVLLTPQSCDPLNRRCVRVSMGTVFKIPWTWLDAPAESLHKFGFKTVALALTERSVSIDDAKLQSEPKLAMILGTEGDGLPAEVIAAADYTVRIPMARSVDSLNVAAAAAIAFWTLRRPFQND